MAFDPPELDRDPAYWRAVAMVSMRNRDLHRLAIARAKIDGLRKLHRGRSVNETHRAETEIRRSRESTLPNVPTESAAWDAILLLAKLSD
jgi:hypothetical protein